MESSAGIEPHQSRTVGSAATGSSASTIVPRVRAVPFGGPFPTIAAIENILRPVRILHLAMPNRFFMPRVTPTYLSFVCPVWEKSPVNYRRPRVEKVGFHCRPMPPEGATTAVAASRFPARQLLSAKPQKIFGKRSAVSY
jgi:hypothetical protein